jgi:hypothetical protein
MTEMNEKKGKLKVTVELEVNEELMDVVKDAMSKASAKIPGLMKRGGGYGESEKKE